MKSAQIYVSGYQRQAVDPEEAVLRGEQFADKLTASPHGRSLDVSRSDRKESVVWAYVKDM